jgi:hypothetical protein
MRNKSGDFPIGTTLPPQSVAAGGSATATFIDVGSAAWWVAVCFTGALGGGTATFKWRQATDAVGTGAKDVAGAPGSATKAPAANSSAVIDLDPQALDLAGGFRFIAPRVDVVGGTGTLVGAAAVACDPHYQT